MGDNHPICRYIRQDNSPDCVSKACDAIFSLLKDNVHLVPIFDKETLRETAHTFPYLIINGRAVCISTGRHTHSSGNTNNGTSTGDLDDLDPTCTDMFFSESLLEEPVKCTENHVFEEQHIKFWIARVGKSRCPLGEDHKICKKEREIRVDEGLKSRISSLVQAWEKKHETECRRATKIQQLEKKQKELELVMNANRVAMDSLLHRAAHRIDLAAVPVKLVCKVGTIVSSKAAVKISHAALRIFARSIPFVSIAIGIALAANRIRNKEFPQAGVELFSGLIETLVPGIGTGIGILGDAGLAFWDWWEMKNGKLRLTLTEKRAVQMFGFEDCTTLTNKEIDTRFRLISKEVHSDHAKMLDGDGRGDTTLYQQTASMAKGLVYKRYGIQGEAV